MDYQLEDKIKIFIRDISEKYDIDFAYIFGSIAKGKESSNSDIDIAIKFKNDYSPMQDALMRGELIDIGSKYFDRKLDVISLNKSTPILIYEVIKEGCVIKDSENRSSFESLAFREYFDFKYYSDIYNDKVLDRVNEQINIKENNYGK